MANKPKARDSHSKSPVQLDSAFSRDTEDDFDGVMRKLVAVPKSELDEEIRKDKRIKSRKKPSR
jgi:hypothetical protein